MVQIVMSQNQGELDARDRGNPWDWNTPEWHIWNAGYQACVRRTIHSLAKHQQPRRLRDK